MSTRRLLPRGGRRNKGQAAVEFSLVALIIVFILVGIIDFSRLFFTWASMSNAAREGARYGTLYPLRRIDADYPSPNNITFRTRAMLSTLGATTPQIEIRCYDQWSGWRENERYWCGSGNQIHVTVQATFRSWTRILPQVNLTAKSAMVIE